MRVSIAKTSDPPSKEAAAAPAPATTAGTHSALATIQLGWPVTTPRGGLVLTSMREISNTTACRRQQHHAAVPEWAREHDFEFKGLDAPGRSGCARRRSSAPLSLRSH